MNQDNPYLKAKPENKAPTILRVPMYPFKSGAAVEEELELEELCIARIPNTGPKGYTHHVAMVYKDENGLVYSAVMVQHQGELKQGTREALKSVIESKPSLSPKVYHDSRAAKNARKNKRRKKRKNDIQAK